MVKNRYPILSKPNMKVQFTLRPVHYWLSLLAMVLVACSVYFFSGNFNFEEEEEEEEGEEKIVLQSMDLWTSMRAYPNAEIDASSYVPAAKQSQGMTLEARMGRLGLNAPAAAPWTNIAPFNFSGRILCVAIHPTNANIMFVGSASGGLWKTTTGGTGTQTNGSVAPAAYGWTYVPTGFPVLGVGAVAFDPNNGNTIYAGTGEVYSQGAPSTGTIGAGNIRTFRGSYGIGILKSTDGGTTWSQVLSFAKTALVGVMDIVVNPLNSNIVYAATTNGLYRSTNAGASWSLIHNVPLAFTVRFKTDDPNNTLFVSCGNFASTGTGIYKTLNASAASPTFTKLTSGLPTPISGKIILATTPASATTIYASIGNSPYIQTDPEGLYVSTDAGATWTARKSGAASIIGGQGWYGHALAVSRANANTLLWGELDTYRSTNGGSTITKTGNWGSWDPANKAINDLTEGVTNTTAYVHADVHQIVNSPNDATGNTFFVCTDGGLFRTTNAGTSFNSLNGGLNTAQMYSNISISQTDPNFMLIGLQDNEAMVYDGTPGSRRITNLGDGFHTAIDPSNDNNCFVESYFLRISKSTNKAANATAFTSVLTNGTGTTPTENACFNGPFVIAKSNPAIMYGGTIYVKKSTASGGNGTWNTVNGGAMLAGANNPILYMAVDPNDANKVFASTVPASGIRSKVFKSTNGGTSFTDITGTLPDRFYSKILLDKNNPNRIVVTLSGFGSSHVYLSTNGGTNWTDIGFGLPDVPVNTAMWDPNNPNLLYIGSDLGVYYANGVSTTTTAASYFVSWTAYNTGLGDAVMVSDMVATPGGSPVIRLATFGRGLWEGPLAPAVTLPARVVTFTGARQGSANHLDWTSSVEVNVGKYVIEYSSDGRTFTDVGSVAAAGNSNTPKKYGFDHLTAPGVAYYRIRIVDIDGHTEYTEVVTIKDNVNAAGISMFPNPTDARTTVRIGAGATGEVNYRVVDMNGRDVLTGKVSLTGAAQELPINVANKPAGMYTVVLDGKNLHWTGKLVKR